MELNFIRVPLDGLEFRRHFNGKKYKVMGTLGICPAQDGADLPDNIGSVKVGDVWFFVDAGEVRVIYENFQGEEFQTMVRNITDISVAERIVHNAIWKAGIQVPGYVMTTSGYLWEEKDTVTTYDGRVARFQDCGMCADDDTMDTLDNLYAVNGLFHRADKVEPCPYCHAWKEVGKPCEACMVEAMDGTRAPRATLEMIDLWNGSLMKHPYVKPGYKPEGYWRCLGCHTWYPDGQECHEEIPNVCVNCLKDEIEGGDSFPGDIPGEAKIYGYHDQRKGKWFGDTEKCGYKGFGFELEVDNNPKSEREHSLYNNLFVRDLLEDCGLDKDECVFEHDGSLNDGFEIVSMPHTVDAFWEKQEAWGRLLETCARAGFKSHDAGSCGLHVHVSMEMLGKTNAEVESSIGKIHRFYHKYWDDIVKVSRRTNFRYCEKPDACSENTGRVIGDNDSVLKWRLVRRGGHYNALNDRHGHPTLEFRLGRGTLNKSSFFAWIDFCLVVARNARKSGPKLLDAGEWLKGIRPTTAQYMLSRGAFSDAIRDIMPEVWYGGHDD